MLATSARSKRTENLISSFAVAAFQQHRATATEACRARRRKRRSSRTARIQSPVSLLKSSRCSTTTTTGICFCRRRSNLEKMLGSSPNVLGRQNGWLSATVAAARANHQIQFSLSFSLFSCLFFSLSLSRLWRCFQCHQCGCRRCLSIKSIELETGAYRAAPPEAAAADERPTVVAAATVVRRLVLST